MRKMGCKESRLEHPLIRLICEKIPMKLNVYTHKSMTKWRNLSWNLKYEKQRPSQRDEKCKLNQILWMKGSFPRWQIRNSFLSGIHGKEKRVRDPLMEIKTWICQLLQSSLPPLRNTGHSFSWPAWIYWKTCWTGVATKGQIQLAFLSLPINHSS